MAFATSALLETPMSRDPSASIGANADQENANPNSAEGQSSVAQVQNRLHDNFWVAYDALDLRQQNMGLLRRGIDLAKEMQQAIVRVGNSLIDKKEIKPFQTFRYCIL